MDYSVFRKIIASCVENKKDNIFFRINIHKLCRKLEKFGIIPVLYKTEYMSKAVEPDDLFLLLEYFKEDKLDWFDGERTFLSMLFVREEDMTDELQDLLHDISISKIKRKRETTCGSVKLINDGCDCCCNCNDSNVDVKSSLISIITKYPCYSAIIAKWVKEDSISLNIRFRASSLLINSDKEDDGEEKETE